MHGCEAPHINKKPPIPMTIPFKESNRCNMHVPPHAACIHTL